jgi:hypothetical protein
VLQACLRTSQNNLSRKYSCRLLHSPGLTFCSPSYAGARSFLMYPLLTYGPRVHKTVRAGLRLNAAAGRAVYRRADTRKTLAAVRCSARM